MPAVAEIGTPMRHGARAMMDVWDAACRPRGGTWAAAAAPHAATADGAVGASECWLDRRRVVAEHCCADAATALLATAHRIASDLSTEPDYDAIRPQVFPYQIAAETFLT